jgi:hypothetical protein
MRDTLRVKSERQRSLLVTHQIIKHLNRTVSISRIVKKTAILLNMAAVAHLHLV